MDKNDEVVEEVIIETLESEVKKFANTLPYWAKFLSSQILDGIVISDGIIETVYNYLLEDLDLKATTVRPVIELNYNAASLDFKSDLLIKNLTGVEGVNALLEDQVIEFSEFLTVLYGANGSGKSGYIRLLKKVFYSKAPEEILPNVHLSTGHKAIKADFSFSSAGKTYPLQYPTNHDVGEFQQYSIFDGKSVISHLEQKNEFEFRPAGLSFFADYSAAISKLEQRLQVDVATKSTLNNFDLWFDGDSEIKKFVQGLSANTKEEDLKKYAPFSNEDKLAKEDVQKKYDELLLTSAGKDRELKNLGAIKKLIIDNRLAIENLNSHFTKENLKTVEDAVTDLNVKEAIAKAEGLENFTTDNIVAVGTPEWKNFIVSASELAAQQKVGTETYPTNGDNCLLCQQPLSEDAEKLLANLWKFVKSLAEEDAKKAKGVATGIKETFEKLSFDLFPADNTLTTWLTEKYPNVLSVFKENLLKQGEFSTSIISNIEGQHTDVYVESKINTDAYNAIIEAIDINVKTLTEGEESKELAKFLASKVFYDHKEKFNTHLPKFEVFVDQLVWIKKAGKAPFAKRQITDAEKNLSNKYFNQRYIDAFNHECKQLNGDFGIDINHTGTAGKSYRQLRLKGLNPNAVLSEGEQKVIAIADFLAEMQMSDINRGIVFDDPVTSLDDYRKSEIARRLVEQSASKQVVIFTHDLAFVSALLAHCKNFNVSNDCHWIENIDGKQPGKVWLKNTPSYEKEYKTSGKAQKCLADAKAAAPELREQYLKNGFAALRTSYEAMVVFTLFNGAVQRFEERVSVDSLAKIRFDDTIREELLDSFYQCCRYMEGHLHSNKYQYVKPTNDNLQEEIRRFDALNGKAKALRI